MQRRIDPCTENWDIPTEEWNNCRDEDYMEAKLTKHQQLTAKIIDHLRRTNYVPSHGTINMKLRCIKHLVRKLRIELL